MIIIREIEETSLLTMVGMEATANDCTQLCTRCRTFTQTPTTKQKTKPTLQQHHNDLTEPTHYIVKVILLNRKMLE